jgi:hypothetical protein
MLPVCNSPETIDDLLFRWMPTPDASRSERIGRLVPQTALGNYRSHPLYRRGVEYCRALTGFERKNGP